MDLKNLADAARFYGCSVFELAEREDRETWLEAWERVRAAERGAGIEGN